MLGEDTNDHTQTCDVVVTRTFDAPVEEVWKSWSDPEYVRRWWGPVGFTSPGAEMDFRVGGASLVCMRASADDKVEPVSNSPSQSPAVRSSAKADSIR